MEDFIYWIIAIMTGIFFGGLIQYGLSWLTETMTQNYLRKLKERQGKKK